MKKVFIHILTAVALVIGAICANAEPRRLPKTIALGTRGVALILRDIGCPISQKYGPRLKEMETFAKAREIPFIYVYVGAENSEYEVKKDRDRFGFQGEYVVDSKLNLVQLLDAKTTTEVLLADADGIIHYHGALDNQHTLFGSNLTDTQPHLRQAINKLANGQPLPYRRTDAPGCAIGYSRAAVASDLTFHQDIYPTLERKCLMCHGPGEYASFDLTTYDKVKNKSRMIEYVLERGLMPPWPLKNGAGPWVNDLSLSKSDKAKILTWLRSEMREGKPTTTSRVKEDTGGWRFGKPDHIVKIPRKVEIPASGFMDYQRFVVKTGLKRERWVKSFEVLTKTAHVHHILIYALKNPKKDGDFSANSIAQFGWSVGGMPFLYPERVGVRLPADVEFGFEVHYQPNGVAEIDDITQIGFRFHDVPPDHELVVWNEQEFDIRIPPGAADYKTFVKKEVNEDVSLIALNSHMHLRGRLSEFDLVHPNGKRERLLTIDPYNFGHQILFQYKDPKPIQRGSRFECVNHYDNSGRNPLNPNPQAEVRRGDQAADEMSICNFYLMRRLSRNLSSTNSK